MEGMGLSQGQKKRRYGANTKAAHTPGGGTPDPQQSETRELRQFMEERAAHDRPATDNPKNTANAKPTERCAYV